ncbi:DHA2 family efflux MFS transporter permease subunit [Amycolatopsis orientalis]|uniref:DHA2 family efflux MFS transporter permease subunit n=1 Tax=Amycolatopsis orientalis TaxID=31958 RepID=UPI0009DB75E5
MATLDSTIVSVGVETLAERFDASVAEVQWVTTAYLLAVVTAVPASGWLAARFGGRRTWLTAVVVFVAASVWCGLADSLPMLVGFRVLQGLAGGVLPPTGQALLARAAGPERIGRLISVVGVVPLLSPVLGPLASGAILSVADWPWLFYVNLPVGLVAVVLGLRYVAADRPTGPREPFDFRGAALLSPGLALVVFGLTGFSDGCPQLVSSAAVVVGLLMVAAFVRHGLRAPAPLLDPRLFTRPPFGAAALALVVLGASVFGTMFLLPFYLRRGAGLGAWDTGLLLVPQGIGAAAGSVLVHRLVDRTAPRTLVLSGIVLVASGTAAFTQLGPELPDVVLVISLLLRGFGAAMISAPVLALVYRSLEKTQLPKAAGALNLLNTLGGSVGTAVLALLLQTRLAARGTDVAAAFADTFWWVLGLVVVAAAGAAKLPKERSR